MTTICIYHSPCADGFGAAWAARHFLGPNIEFHPAKYGDAPPDVTGKDVVMVDFSYKQPVIEEMRNTAHSILVLDHHETAQEDLSSYVRSVRSWNSWMEYASGVRVFFQQAPIAAIFDMNRSGAGLTWDFFSNGAPRPQLLNHIEDRDLWKFELEGTREIQAALFSFDYNFEVWDDLMTKDSHTFIPEGTGITRKLDKDLRELLKEGVRFITISGYKVPVANLPYTMSSEGGHMLLKMYPDAPFAACYMDGTKHRNFSLRSEDSRVSVSEVAKGFGGGGHRNASGFKMPIGWEGNE